MLWKGKSTFCWIVALNDHTALMSFPSNCEKGSFLSNWENESWYCQYQDSFSLYIITCHIRMTEWHVGICVSICVSSSLHQVVCSLNLTGLECMSWRRAWFSGRQPTLQTFQMTVCDSPCWSGIIINIIICAITYVSSQNIQIVWYHLASLYERLGVSVFWRS